MQDSYEKGEIDLLECLRICIKRKNTVFAVLLLFLVLIMGAIFVLPNQYEAVSVVRIGGITSPLFSPVEALYEVQTLKSLSQLNNALGLSLSLPEFLSIVSVESIDNASLIRIKTRAVCPELSATICNGLANIFFSRGNEIYNKEFMILDKRVNRLKANRLVADRERILALEKEMLLSKNFEVFLPAVTPIYPVVSQKRSKIITLLFTVGVILAVLVVFLQEHWANSRKKHK